jgi:hypothetical protein
MSRSGQTEPPSFLAAMAELVSIADVGEASRPSTGVGHAQRRQVLPRNRPPRRAAVISALGQHRTLALQKRSRHWPPSVPSGAHCVMSLR